MSLLVADVAGITGHARIIAYAQIASVRQQDGGFLVLTLAGELLELEGDFELLAEGMMKGLPYDARTGTP